MEFFKYFLFGIAGLSIIFWVSVIALWHTYMFPRLFKEDYSPKIVSNGLSGSPKSEITRLASLKLSLIVNFEGVIIVFILALLDDVLTISVASEYISKSSPRVVTVFPVLT